MSRTIIERTKRDWNTFADSFNQWGELGLDEKVDLINRQVLLPGDELYSMKSGNRVRLLSRHNADWLVERVDGASTGKQMIVSISALRWCVPGTERAVVNMFD